VITSLLVCFLLSACSQSLLRAEAPPAAPAAPTAPGVASWEWAAVGYPDAAGGSGVEIVDTPQGETVVMSGTGGDVFGTSDQFVYFYTQLEQYGSLAARLAEFDAPAGWSKAGIMIRQSLDAAAENALVHVSGNNGAVFQVRSEQGRETTVLSWDPDRAPATTWLRLTRNASGVLAELSGDGRDWAPLSSYPLALEGPVFIGFAVAANAEGALEPSGEGAGRAVATFSELAIALGSQNNPPQPGAPEPAPPPAGPGPAAPSSGRYELPAATLYVAPDGNDAASGREAGRPTTLRRAAETVQPGDVVYLAGGEYPVHVNFLRSGTEAAPIIWASAPGEWAVLDGGPARGRRQDRVFVNGVRWNVFADFEVRNSPNQGILVSNSHDNLFYGIVTHGNHGSGIQLMDSNRNRLQNVVSYDNFDSQNAGGQPGQDADGIGISSGDGNVILNCVSYFNSDDGVDLWRSTNSLVDGCISFGNGRGEFGNGNGFKLGGPIPRSDSTVRRSIAFHNKAHGFTSNGARNIMVLNNTAFANGGSNFEGTATTTFRNNIAATGGVRPNGAASDNNSWDLGVADVRFESTEPGSEAFLALAPDSPLASAGVDVGLPYEGDAPDLGALQRPQTWASLVGNPQFDMSAALELIRNGD